MNHSFESSDRDSYPSSSSGAEDPIDQIFRSSKTIAVVGLSSRRHRPSFGVSEYMQSAGYRIIPVNPGETKVLGEKSYGRLEDIPEKIDIVDIFRRSEFVPEIVASAVHIGARAIWMQEGVVHAEAAEQARRAGTLRAHEFLHFESSTSSAIKLPHGLNRGRKREEPPLFHFSLWFYISFSV